MKVSELLFACEAVSLGIFYLKKVSVANRSGETRRDGNLEYNASTCTHIDRWHAGDRKSATLEATSSSPLNFRAEARGYN